MKQTAYKRSMVPWTSGYLAWSWHQKKFPEELTPQLGSEVSGKTAGRLAWVGDEDHSRKKKYHVQRPWGTMNWMLSRNRTEMSKAGKQCNPNEAGDLQCGHCNALWAHYVVKFFSILRAAAWCLRVITSGVIRTALCLQCAKQIGQK